jgi:gamma-glutamylcyclotransferase (GGCT)/AIG2-like uncharacterized protein YtfP
VARIFVYGTLMRGEPGADLLAAARFLGAARTTPRYLLLDLGAYPALCEGGACAVAGELYELDEALLAAIDDYEGHPDLFRRAPISLEGGAVAEGYLFARAPSASSVAPPRIDSGDWRASRKR